MGTKNNPGQFDCYANAGDDEPMFVLLARDLSAPETVRSWARRRVIDGLNAKTDDQILEAFECADAMERWRRIPR